MSLSYFIDLPEVRGRLKALRPKFPRKLDIPPLVDRRSNRNQLIGTAFDYLLRFELHRRTPHATTKSWVAEHASWKILDTINGEVLQLATPEGPVPERLTPRKARKLAQQASEVLQAAKKSVLAYRRVKNDPAGRWPDLAAHAIRLAKLDLVFRSGYLDLSFPDARADDVVELVDLLAIVPFDQLVHARVMHLNPVFGASSAVGGADADLICGDMIVEVKTVSTAEVRADILDQLLGYMLLARQDAATIPEIRRLGIYFARHGYLWTIESSAWLDHPLFEETEAWFFQYALEVFGAEEDEFI